MGHIFILVFVAILAVSCAEGLRSGDIDVALNLVDAGGEDIGVVCVTGYDRHGHVSGQGYTGPEGGSVNLGDRRPEAVFGYAVQHGRCAVWDMDRRGSLRVMALEDGCFAQDCGALVGMGVLGEGVGTLCRQAGCAYCGAGVPRAGRVSLALTDISRETEFVLEAVAGMENVGSAVAFVAGLAPGRMLDGGEAVAGQAVMAFPLYRDGTALRGALRHFGMASEDDEPALYVLLRDRVGNPYGFRYGLSGLPEDSPMCMPSGIVVEKPVGGGSGFVPSLEDWHAVEVPVRL